jgi:2-polyprenyl-3-methyl-5-hydroxy-6-metoxy-1,4-benzoquinol methylase
MERLSHAFRALGDSTRLRIVRLLAAAPLNVSELVSVVGISQPSVSHHLGKLKALELVREERQAGFTYYSLDVRQGDDRWPLVQLAQQAEDPKGDRARLEELLREREDRHALNERLIEPGQSWSLWASALGSLLPPLEVVDFGCGTGTMSIALARWAKDVLGIDQSKSAIEQARGRAKREGVRNVSFVREDLQRLSLPAGKKGLVVISQSLHHVDDPRAVLAQAFRILKKGARAIVLELCPHDQTWVRERLGHRHLGFEPEALRELLSDVGFKNCRLESNARDGSPFRAFSLVGVKE